MLRLVLTCLLGTGLIGGCAATPAPRLPVAPSAKPDLALDVSVYRLSSGDTVRIDVLGEPELSLNVLIDTSGNISYPFLGQIPTAGLTLRQLEQRLYAGLSAGYLRNPDVRASIAHYRPVYVSGQVRQSGAYPYSVGLTVERALTLAGGMTQFASSRRIYVQREGGQSESRARVELSSPVLPGDTIVVEERLF